MRFDHLNFKEAKALADSFRFAGWRNAEIVRRKHKKSFFGITITEYSVETGRKTK